MAHEIMEHDQMFSVRTTPWHGLGNILSDTPDIETAKEMSGLTWSASLRQMKIETTIIDPNGIEIPIDIPVLDNKAIVRDDINMVLGVVGNRYDIYQNQEMWDFISTFVDESEIKLETAGSLKNGKTTWVLAKNGTIESISGDPIEEYFLFRNSFDGSTPISVMFTNVRVVCNNTLTMALKGANNIFNVRHTNSATDQLKEVHKALGLRSKYQTKVKERLDYFAKRKMTSNQVIEFLEEIIFPDPKKLKGISVNVGQNDVVPTQAEVSARAVTTRENKINAILDLVDTGAGADIKGVRGTAYGLYNAMTEWADHEKQTRVTEGRDPNEVKFENAMFGTGAKFKEQAMTELFKYVQLAA